MIGEIECTKCRLETVSRPPFGSPIAKRRPQPDTGPMRELQVVDASELASAYAVAQYDVRLDGDILPLRVGQPATDLEAYWPAQRYAFISAWNPASQPLSDTTNEAADVELVARIDALGASRQAAWAEDGSGQWREAGWLVADLDICATEQLAREFGQAAVLAWRRGEPVRLRMLLGGPGCGAAAMDGAVVAFTDWVE